MSREPKAIPEHGRKANQKMKPYLVMEYLMRNTDENHAAPADAIVEYLRDDLGINTHCSAFSPKPEHRNAPACVPFSRIRILW